MPRIACVSCPNCNVLHRVEVQRDEDGGYADLETSPCQGSDACTKRLCESCAVICDGCSLPCCEEHTVDVAGERFCCLCVAVMESDGLELASQDIVATIALLSAAGCSIDETRAALAIRDRRAS